MLEGNQGWGEYPDIFFFIVIPAVHQQLWMLFFWDWAVVRVSVHETECPCTLNATADTFDMNRPDAMRPE